MDTCAKYHTSNCTSTFKLNFIKVDKYHLDGLKYIEWSALICALIATLLVNFTYWPPNEKHEDIQPREVCLNLMSGMKIVWCHKNPAIVLIPLA